MGASGPASQGSIYYETVRNAGVVEVIVLQLVGLASSRVADVRVEGVLVERQQGWTLAVTNNKTATSSVPKHIVNLQIANHSHDLH